MLRSRSLNINEGLSFQEIGGQNLRNRLELPLPERHPNRESSFSIKLYSTMCIALGLFHLRNDLNSEQCRGDEPIGAYGPNRVGQPNQSQADHGWNGHNVIHERKKSTLHSSIFLKVCFSSLNSKISVNF